MNSTIIFDAGIVKNELNMSKWETLPQKNKKKRPKDKRFTYRRSFLPFFSRTWEKSIENVAKL